MTHVRLVMAVALWIVLSAAAPAEKAQWNDLMDQVRKLYKQGKYESGILVGTRALELAEKTFGRDDSNVAVSMYYLALLYEGEENYAEAEKLVTRSLLIWEKTWGNDHPDVAMLRNRLALLYVSQGKHLEAEAVYKKGLAIEIGKNRLARSDADLLNLVTLMNGLASLYSTQGKYSEAEPLLKRCLVLLEENQNRGLKFRLLVRVARGNLAVLYANLGRYVEAELLCSKSVPILGEADKYVDHDRVADRVANCGVIKAAHGDPKKALEYYQCALGIFLEIDYRYRADWVRTLMAHLHMDIGDLGAAEPLLRETGYDETKARFHLLKSNYGQAKDYYAAVCKDAERSGKAELRLAGYTGLGLAYEGLGDKARAAAYYRKAVEFTEELRSSLDRAQREKFFDVRLYGFSRIAAYEGLARVLTKMQKPVEAFKGSEYTKARVFAEGLSRSSEGSAMGVPAEVIKHDEQLTDQLVALKKARQKACEKNKQLVIQSLNPEIEELENQRKAHIKMLREKCPLFAAVKYPEPMDLAQTALRDNEWVLSYDVTDPGLIIYLTKGKQLIKGIFKPIPRKDVDELVRKFREPLELGDERLTAKKLASFDFASGKKLADVLLSDILSDLPKGTPLIIVPDDSLGVLPFEMLVLNEGGHVKTDKERPYVSGSEFFGDRNPISYYQSVTALTLARTFGKEKKPATKRLVMCDPIFGGDDDERLSKMTKDKQVALLKSLPDKIMSMKTELNMTFPRLSLTGVLGRNLKKGDPAATDEHNGMDAAKPLLFKKPLNDYGSMVFATHGYFGKDLPGIQEPVLVLTLVDQPEGKDGFLRMSEVMGLKLNADMVALTACQTGLGQRISGEGTMGMGRAFQFAGARTVLMSLWNVAESSSVKLVESFFKHLKDGKSKLEALRMARKDIRESGYDHPFFWAPFILVGEVE